MRRGVAHPARIGSTSSNPAPARAVTAATAVVATVLLLTLPACAKKPVVPMVAPPGQWIALFNGKNLDGWTVKIAGHAVGDNYANTFRVENGVLKVSYDQYDKFGGQFGSLFTQKKYTHYWLHAEYRFTGKQAPGAPSWAYQNSGLQLHSQTPESMRKEQEFPVSVEFDIVGGRLLGHHPTGDVCQNGTLVKVDGAPLKGQCSTVSDVTVPGEDWVTVEAEVDGATRIRQAVNGALVVESTDFVLDERNPDAQRLLAAGADKSWGSGAISVQSNSHPIEFRRIDIRPLDP